MGSGDALMLSCGDAGANPSSGLYTCCHMLCQYMNINSKNVAVLSFVVLMNSDFQLTLCVHMYNA
jgi:hypothetical protein